MIRLLPRSTLTDNRVPYTTLFLSGRRHDDDEGGDGTAFVHDPPRKVSMGSTKVAVSVRVPGTRSSARSARSTVHETDVATVPPAVNRETSTDTSSDRQLMPPDSSVAEAADRKGTSLNSSH